MVPDCQVYSFLSKSLKMIKVNTQGNIFAVSSFSDCFIPKKVVHNIVLIEIIWLNFDLLPTKRGVKEIVAQFVNLFYFPVSICQLRQFNEFSIKIINA